MKKTAALLLLIPLLCGCAQMTEIDSLLIVSGIAVDKDGDGYLLTTQAVNIKSSDQNDRSAVFIKKSGRSLGEALSAIVTTEGEKPFYNHTQIIFISEKLSAEEGLSHLMETLNLEGRFRSSIRLAVTLSSAEEVIRAKTKTDDISAFALNETIDQSSSMLKTPDTPFFCFLNDVLEDGADGILPLLTLETEEDRFVPVICGAALFKDDRFVGSLSTLESQFLMLAKNEIEDSCLIIGDSVYRIIKSKPGLTMDGINATVTIDATLLLLEGETRDKETARSEAEKGIREGLIKLFDVLKETGCDPIGIGRHLKRKDLTLWRSVYPVLWENIYKNLPIEYDINIKIADSAKIVSGETK